MTESREKPKENKDHAAIEIRGQSNLQLPKNSVFALLGSNGEGKTTTIKFLLGLTRPTSGSGAILAHDFTMEYQKTMI